MFTIMSTIYDLTITLYDPDANYRAYIQFVTSEQVIESDDSTATADVSLYYQSGGFENFDGVPSWDGTTFVQNRVWNGSSYDFIDTTTPLYMFVEDTEGKFDCTHGFDLVQIEIASDLQYILQENGDYLLQENGDRIIF